MGRRPETAHPLDSTPGSYGGCDGGQASGFVGIGMDLMGENRGGRRPYLRWDRPAELSTSPTPQSLPIIGFYFAYVFVAILFSRYGIRFPI